MQEGQSQVTPASLENNSEGSSQLHSDLLHYLNSLSGLHYNLLFLSPGPTAFTPTQSAVPGKSSEASHVQTFASEPVSQAT